MSLNHENTKIDAYSWNDMRHFRNGDKVDKDVQNQRRKMEEKKSNLENR